MSDLSQLPPRPLPRGLILGVLRHAGMNISDNGRDKISIKCPLPGHDDQNPSALVWLDHNTFFCSAGCTPGGSWTTKKLSEALGVPWPPQELRPRATTAPKDPFTPSDARSLWDAALAQCVSSIGTGRETNVMDYLLHRKLVDACAHRAVGILTSNMHVHPAIRSWVKRQYCVVAPMYDVRDGTLVNVQARRVVPSDKRNPKTLVPAGSRAAGTCFANEAGRAMLSGQAVACPNVVLGEGLTDHLALTIALGDSTAVISLPGVGNAVRSIGPWAQGRVLYVATDNDDAGKRVLNFIARAAREHGASKSFAVTWPKHTNDACDALSHLGADGLRQFFYQRIFLDQGIATNDKR